VRIVWFNCRKLSSDDHSVVSSSRASESGKYRPGSARSHKSSIGSDADASSVGSSSTVFTQKSSLSGNKTSIIQRRNSLDRNLKLNGLPPPDGEMGKSKSRAKTSSVSFGKLTSAATGSELLKTPNHTSAAGSLPDAGSFGREKVATLNPSTPVPKRRALTAEQKLEVEKRDNLLKEAAPMLEKQPVSALWQFYKKPKRPQLTSNMGKTLGVPNLGPYGVMPVRTHIRPYSDSMDHSLYLRVVGSDDPEGSQPLPLLRVIERGEQERDRIKATRNNEQYRAVRFMSQSGFNFIIVRCSGRRCWSTANTTKRCTTTI
jgi:hypothetical protein